MQKKVKWGVLSTSSTAVGKAIPAIMRCPNAELAAIASRDIEKARQHAAKFGDARAYGSYEELLADPDVEAVYIPLPNSMHAEWTVRAAKAGKHVLCEKPASVLIRDMRRMLKACSDNNVKFMEGFFYSFHPQIDVVKTWIADHRVGDLLLVRISFSFKFEQRHSKIRLQKALEGGALADVGSYAVDLSHRLTGLDPIRVFASGGRKLDGGEEFEVETNFAAVLEYDNGLRVEMDGGFDRPRQSRCEIVGRAGVITIDSPFLPVANASVRLQSESGDEEQTFALADPWQMQFEHFSNCIINDEQPAVSAVDTDSNVRVLSALRDSLAAKSPVNVAPALLSKQAVIKKLQEACPNGVDIETSATAIPSYGSEPKLWTALKRNENGEIKFVLLAQGTADETDVIVSVPDALGINGETQIGLTRANRIMPKSQTSRPQNPKAKEPNLEECTICPDEKRLRERGEDSAFEMNNIRCFGPLLHKVVTSYEHIHTFDDPRILDACKDSARLLFEMSEEGLKSVGGALDGLSVGMNFGEYDLCGASQEHFHYQVAGLSGANYNAGARLGALCRSYRQAHPGADYLADYEVALRKANMIIAEKDNLAFAFAPVSPRFRAEVQIMLKRGTAGNILDTTRAERDALGELQCEVIHLFGKAGYTALNQVWYMTRFSDHNDFGQRLIISLYPRKSIYSFYELSGNFVIDAMPWATSETLRNLAGNG